MPYHLRIINSMYFFFYPNRVVQETTFDLGGDVHSGTALPTSKVGNSVVPDRAVCVYPCEMPWMNYW